MTGEGHHECSLQQDSFISPLQHPNVGVHRIRPMAHLVHHPVLTLASQVLLGSLQEAQEHSLLCGFLQEAFLGTLKNIVIVAMNLTHLFLRPSELE